MTAPLRWVPTFGLLGTIFALVLAGSRAGDVREPAHPVGPEAADWPMYNHDVLGTRHNAAEKAIGRANAGQLVEKWRFPPAGSQQTIGVIHATPVVVGGYVYFGTATDPAFYKLTPDGKVRWSYRNPTRPKAAAPAANAGEAAQRGIAFKLPKMASSRRLS